MKHKAGFINIIGNPNVGKSTLMNALVGERLSIITPKKQTTRHRIKGILSGDDFQMVFSDTPGIVDPAYKLHESMMNYVQEALRDADVLLYVTDPRDIDPKEHIIEKLNELDIPIILILNKIDNISSEMLNEWVEKWHTRIPKAEILPMSALHKLSCDLLMNKLHQLLPESPAYFDKEDLTDKSLRFIASETIRQYILELYDKEIPYSCEVKIEKFVEEPHIIRIGAVIYVMRDTQKGIIIGHKGVKIKELGEKSRFALEDFCGKKVFLETFVKVDPNWRNEERKLKGFGYQF
ncbi:MAG: GTPase Era [Flavobacteriales bacterium]